MSGRVPVYGAKNAATKMMIASLLTNEACEIRNMPRINDIDITKELCEQIGSEVEIGEDRVCRVQTAEIKTSLVPELSRKNRLPILALGPLLHRKKVAEVPVLGGCPIGHRPVNLHVDALEQMGARIERREFSYYAEAEELHGADIQLAFPSVGATENILIAATLAKGETTIANAAIEPEIINLIQMLQAMGADITVDAEQRIMRIRGVDKLHGASADVMPDRVEIVSFATAALATEGDIFIPAINSSYIERFLEKVTELGGHYEEKDDGIRFWGKKPYKAVRVETQPHPGFLTDWQQPFCVLLTQAAGESIIHETLYEDRFGYTKDLATMGANIEISDDCPAESPCRFQKKGHAHVARITGPTHLVNGRLTVPDLRAGMAHIIAGLISEGETHIFGIDHIERGYERIDERLQILGADIQRID